MAIRRLLLVSVALCIGGCKKDEITWVPFNAEGQTLVVDVLPSGSSIGAPVEIELLSSLGRTVIGVGAVDPGSGPVGTSHLVTVDVLDEFEALVGRATVEVDTEAVSDLDGDGDEDARGAGEYEMRRDSADPGAFAITMQSLGADDESREDRFTLHVWEPEQLEPTVEDGGTTP